MFDENEILSIAREEIERIVKYDNAQHFVNKCLRTNFMNCKESLEWYERNGRIYYVPKCGDQIFIDNTTGIVEMVVGDKVYTIEVDTDIDSSFYSLIRRNQRAVEDGVYGRPEYERIETITGPRNIDEIKEWLSTFNIIGDIKEGLVSMAKIYLNVDSYDELEVSWKLVKRGDIGLSVQIVQAALICAGYSCGEHGANGYFNDDSVEALKRFQKDNKMICDGIAGKAILIKLLKK